MDAATITHSIQLSIAPVFFLTAVSGMVGAVAQRLARIIDRARVVEASIPQHDDPVHTARCVRELAFLRRRGHVANVSIGLLTLCGFLIGLTIAFLFLAEFWHVGGPHLVVGSFLGGVVSFLAALACFLWETVLATQILKFDVLAAVDELEAAPRR
ncbi:DUF2721 domain-containing protein [Comamonas serinivorans]|nr:DUF2721 domain-containing protein [Comamonas serinivorans]